MRERSCDETREIARQCGPQRSRDETGERDRDKMRDNAGHRDRATR